MMRARLPHRRFAETFNFEVGGLHYVCTVGRFPDGGVAEIFLNNGKATSDSDTNARDAGIVASIAFQCGADVETIRRALCRDGLGRASGPLGAALDLVAGEAPP